MKEKYAYIFFNCDEEKSQQSMNLFYNQEIYHDLKGARRALLAKIEQEQAEGRIRIQESDLPAVRQAVLEGDPTEASAYICYGTIERFPII